MPQMIDRLADATYRRYCAARRSVRQRAALARLRQRNAISSPVHGAHYLVASHGCSVGPGCRFEGAVEIGAHTTLSPDCHLSGEIKVGRYSQFGPKCVVLASDHPTDTITPFSNAKLFNGRLKRLHRDAPVQIGDGVLIGAASILLPGTVVGRGVIIGAGSVVRGTCEPYGLYAGNPARLIRMRLSEAESDEIERTRWWEREPHELAEMEHLFFRRYARVVESRR